MPPDATPRHPRPLGCNPSNLIAVPLRNCATLPNQLCVCLFNAQSVGDSKERSEIFSFISDYDVDVMLLTETWLHESGDDAKCRDLTTLRAWLSGTFLQRKDVVNQCLEFGT